MTDLKRNTPSDIFDSYEEYLSYLKKAYALYQDMKKSRDPSFAKIVPEYLEVEFTKSIKAPRLYFPRNKGVIVVQIPLRSSPRSRQRMSPRSRRSTLPGLLDRGD